jgi:cytochrome P450
MQAIAIEVILAIVLGVSDRARRDRLRALLPQVLETNPITVLLEGRRPWLAKGVLGRVRPSIRARREAERLLLEEIEEHRADPARSDDILAMLIATRDENGKGLSDAELLDQLMTLLLAGHETTATSLAWCFERILRHPAALARLRVELADDQTVYLDAVIKETMRTRPVVEAVWRVLTKPLTLGDYRLPAGTVVAPVIRAVGRATHSDPAEFRPERFLEEEDAPRYSLIPFGGGTRRCLGASFATMEMKIVLRTVLERLDLRAVDPAPEKVSRSRRFTTSPARGARVVATAAGRS